MKLQWFQDEWQDRPSWIPTGVSAVHHYWVCEFQMKVPLVRPSESSTPTPIITVTEAAPNVPNWKSKKRQRQAAVTLDQLEQFQEWDPDDECPSGVLQY
jgi:hypothetical protein